MLKYRKDAGTGNKLTLYWDENGRKDVVDKNDHDKYWGREVDRLKNASKYDNAQAQQKIDELELDNKTLKAMLHLCELRLQKAMTS